MFDDLFLNLYLIKVLTILLSPDRVSMVPLL
jgi:hypothetical protein